MTAIVPREDESSPVPRRMLLAIAAACALLATSSESFAYDGPTFRSGLWKFERTLETDGKANDRLQTSGLPIARQMTRCVNPTLELRAEFTPLKTGGCSTKDLRKTDDGCVFQKVCGDAAPLKTESCVKADRAYTQIHQPSSNDPQLLLGVRQPERQERQLCHQHIELIIVFLIAGFLKRTLSPPRKAQNVNFDRTRDRRIG